MKNINLKEFSKEELKTLIEQAQEEIKRARLTEKEKDFLNVFKDGVVMKRTKTICFLFGDTDEQVGTRIEIAQLNGLSFDGLEIWERYNISDLTKLDYQITLTEFWESNNVLAIHCDTEEKAETLCKAFHKMDKTWSNSDSYVENNDWDRHRENTCYYNDGDISHIDYVRYKNYTSLMK